MKGADTGNHAVLNIPRSTTNKHFQTFKNQEKPQTNANCARTSTHSRNSTTAIEQHGQTTKQHTSSAGFEGHKQKDQRTTSVRQSHDIPSSTNTFLKNGQAQKENKSIASNNTSMNKKREPSAKQQ